MRHGWPPPGRTCSRNASHEPSPLRRNHETPMLPRASRAARRGAGAACARAGDRVRHAAHREPLPRLGAGAGSPDLPGRVADHLHAPLGEQDRRQVGVGPLDHERRRLAPSLPAQGVGRPLVARRHAHPLSRRWRAQGDASVRALDGRRGRLVPGDTRERDTDGAEVGASRPLVSRPGYWADPAVSPDGRSVAFTGYDSTDHTHRTSDLYVAGIDGSGMRDVSHGFDRDPADLFWGPDGKGVYFTAGDRGSINVHYADLSGAVRDVTQGVQVVSLTAVARTGVAVGARSDPQHPADVVRFDLRRPQALARVTAVNDDVLQNKRLATVEEVWYPSSGGARIQGWIVKPPAFAAARRYPLILEIHGGPFAMYNVGFSYMFQNFAANGYVVLYTNPRGSTGYGDTFSNGIDHNYPGPDYDDLMAGVDAVIGRGFIDTTRMYVSGCSGGGVLSSWVIGHTTRFAAAAVRCPVINWIAMAGETDVPLFTYSFFHQPFWEKPDEWLAHSSLMYVGRVTTPTLLMTGELDRRTPIPQTEEYYAALKMRHVPAVLLRFSDEFHGTGSKPANFTRTQLYMMSWFAKYKTGGGSAASSQANL